MIKGCRGLGRKQRRMTFGAQVNDQIALNPLRRSFSIRGILEKI